MFGDASPVPLAGLLARLDAAVARQGGDCFVRLTSRSPKDSLRALRLGLRVADGRQALALFLEASQRCAHDLRMSLDCAIPLAIVVRPWLRFEARQEWRVFMRNHAWAGASARVGLGAADRPWLERRAAALRPHLFGLVTTLARASPTTDVAFDVIVSDEPNGADDPVVLLDANPLGPLTDLGWFASIGTLDGGLRMGPSRL